MALNTCCRFYGEDFNDSDSLCAVVFVLFFFLSLFFFSFFLKVFFSFLFTFAKQAYRVMIALSSSLLDGQMSGQIGVQYSPPLVIITTITISYLRHRKSPPFTSPVLTTTACHHHSSSPPPHVITSHFATPTSPRHRPPRIQCLPVGNTAFYSVL